MCSSSRHRDRRDTVHDPGDRLVTRAHGVARQRSVADDGRVRASDAERERGADALRLHAAAGRIDTEELERRVELGFWGAALVFKSPPWLLEGRRTTPGRG